MACFHYSAAWIPGALQDLHRLEVRVGEDWTAQAEGRTKKIAAQRAARGVYERMRESH